MLGGSMGRLARARPQQSGLGCSWCIPGNILMDFACPRPHRVVLAAERHRSGRAQSVGPSRGRIWVRNRWVGAGGDGSLFRDPKVEKSSNFKMKPDFACVRNDISAAPVRHARAAKSSLSILPALRLAIGCDTVPRCPQAK